MRPRPLFQLVVLCLVVLAIAGPGAGIAQADPAYFLLEVSPLYSNASGRVASSPVTGIDCGADCAEEMPAGVAITLTATLDPGSQVLAWAGCEPTSPTTCRVTMDQRRLVNVTFGPNSKLRVGIGGSTGNAGTVTRSLTGESCGPDCEAYPNGTEVTLTAHPNAGSRIAEWLNADECAIGSLTCKIGIQGDRDVTAYFSSRAYVPLEVDVETFQGASGSVTSSMGGIDCPGQCEGYFGPGDPVTLTATPQAGSEFGGWSGDCNDTEPTCQLTMDQAHSAGAFFVEPETLMVVVEILQVVDTASIGGTVTGSAGGINCRPDCVTILPNGTPMTLTAHPSDGWKFIAWAEDACAGSSQLTCSFSADGYAYVTASFAPINDTLLRVHVNPYLGSVSAAPHALTCNGFGECQGYFPGGSDVILTAEPIPYAVFASWSGDCAGTGPTDPTCLVTMDGPQDVTATFWPMPVLTVERWFESPLDPLNGSSVTSSPSRIDCTSDGDCSEPFPPGTTVTLTAHPTSGVRVVDWSWPECSPDFPFCIITIGEDMDVQVVFGLDDSGLNVSSLSTAGGAGSITSSPPGIDCPGDCTQSFPLGTEVELTADPDPTSMFLYWSVPGCSGSGLTCRVRVSGPTAVNGDFGPGHELYVVKTGGGSGSVTSSPSGIDCGAECESGYPNGDPVTLTPTAAPGSVFTGWSGDCSGRGACQVTMSQTRQVIAAFQLAKRLSLSFTGTGSATVTSVPIGMDCRTDCVGTFETGEMVRLIPDPDSGTNFIGWSGACSGTPCVVEMDDDHSVTAQFEGPVTLNGVTAGSGLGSFSSSPAGIDCPGDCSESYPFGTQVTLTPHPSPGTEFAGWSGACADLGACVLTMNASRSVTANFRGATVRKLSVSRSGSGAGTVTNGDGGIACPGDCQENYFSDAQVTVSAHVGASSVFVGWAGACSGTNPDCVVTMSQSRSVVAMFGGPQQLSISRDGNGTGTVSSGDGLIDCGSDCSEAYLYGATVTLTASPAAGFEFEAWHGNCEGTVPSCQVSMFESRAITATFRGIPARTLTVTIVGGGSVVSPPGAGIVCPSTCQATYQDGFVVSLAPQAPAGWAFLGWSGACTGTGSCHVTMNATKSVTATFNQPPPELRISLAGNGTGTVSYEGGAFVCPGTCVKTFPMGTVVTMTATPTNGSGFGGWDAACSGTSTTCQVTMNASKTVFVSFFKASLTVQKTGFGFGTVTSSPGGIDCGTDCFEIYGDGTDVTLTAAALSGYLFTGWSGACTGTQSTCELDMTADRFVGANFVNPPRLTVTRTENISNAGTVTGGGGAISCGYNCSATFAPDTVVTLVATPNIGQVFTGWTGACTGTGTCQVTMDQDRSVDARFRNGQVLNVSIDGTGAGMVASGDGSLSCTENCTRTMVEDTTVTLTATPATGSTFARWTGDCTGTGTCQVFMSEPHSVEAIFDPVATLSISDVTVNEGASGTRSATFTVTRSGQLSSAPSVAWTTANATATAPSDYIAGSGTVSFSPGQVTRTITIQVNGDSATEIDEKFHVVLSSPVAAVLTDGLGIGTITNDDQATLRINDVTVNEGASGTVTAAFTITMSGPVGSQVKVTWATADGTAVAPGDYTAAGNTLTFSPGQVTKTVLVQVKGDAATELNETFNVNLSSPVGAVSILDGVGKGTITNDDQAKLRVNDVTVNEGASGTVNAAFAITLSGPVSQQVTVAWATADGTATSGSDYNAASGTATFSPGQVTKTVIVQVKGDPATELNEFFTVELSAPVNAAIADGSGRGTITNDDAATLRVGDVTVNEGNSGTVNASFVITLSGPMSQQVAVAWATADGTAVAPADYNAAGATATFSPGQVTKTVIVQVKGERVVEPNEFFTVVLSSPTNATIADGSGRGTITNDDTAGAAPASGAAAAGPSEGSRAASEASVEEPGPSTERPARHERPARDRDRRERKPNRR
jgi:Calx-beta domain-containing protein/List-Bact-rpt repeat protein